MEANMPRAFSKNDIQFVARVHRQTGRFIQAKVHGKDVEIPYEDARVFLINRGGSVEAEVKNLPTYRCYGKEARVKHFPAMRLGELSLAFEGKSESSSGLPGTSTKEAKQTKLSPSRKEREEDKPTVEKIKKPGKKKRRRK